MEHFVAYHSVKQMERLLEQDGALNFLSRKSGLLKKAIDNTVWVIQGLPAGRRTEYSLCGVYIAEDRNVSITLRHPLGEFSVACLPSN